MSTRSTTKIMEDGKAIAQFYRQCDGYPSGIGQEIANILSKATIVNGYSGNQQVPTHFNGMGCLAAWLIGYLKRDEIGGVYMIANAETDSGQEYTYKIYLKEDVLCLSVHSLYGKKKKLYDGPASQFNGQLIEESEAA